MIQLWEHVYISYLKFSVTDSATFVINTLSLHDALPISFHHQVHPAAGQLHVAEAVTTEESHPAGLGQALEGCHVVRARSEEHTSELQSRGHRVCRLLLEKKKGESTCNNG